MSRQPIDELVERQRTEPEAVLKERLKRLAETIELKTTDRVPFFFNSCSHALSRYYKMSEVVFDYEIFKRAAVKFVEDFPLDAFMIAPGVESTTLTMGLAIVNEYPELVSYYSPWITGPMHDILRDKYTRWPGREVGPYAPPQFYASKFMEAEEYDKLIENPTEFILKVIVPRGTENLSDLGSAKYVATITRLILERQKVSEVLDKTLAEVRARGVPTITPGYCKAPLDCIGDLLRHITNVLVDLHRCPDKVKLATEAILPLALKYAEATTPPQSPLPPLPRLLFIPLHLNDMLPPKLYNEFYWPTLKKIIVEMYSKGVRSYLLCEGDHSPHVNTILELPKGWGIAHFERPKNFIKDVWEKLKGHTVVMGGIPSTLLIGGTPEKIEEYVKNLLREVGPEPGFILSTGVAEIDPTTPAENLKALLNTLFKYGEHRR